MAGLPILGKIFILFGIIFFIIGGIFVLAGKVPLIGKLPGDIHIQKKKFSFYFPLTSSIILSVVLTIILNLILRK
jgi:hypothetical protein